MSESTPSTGAQRRTRAQGRKHERLQEILVSLDPQMGQWADEFIFDQVWGRPGLSEEERMLVAIVILASTEHPDQLRNYLHGAIQAGVPIVKLHEALVMLAVYAGFPAALGALSQLKAVVAIEQRAATGQA
jgi:4-carboxymuconolactone decarboxylase